MRSLRSRLILGSALVALVPLALALVLLSQRIQATVRTQATGRLAGALGMVRSQLLADGARGAEKLGILARDPELKRLYLVPPAGSRDLAAYLAQQRFLLGLDFLQVSDSSGMTIADAATASATALPADRARLCLAHAPAWGLSTIERVEGVPGLALIARAPIRYQGAIVGQVRGGLLLDSLFLARLEAMSGVDLELRDAAGERVTGTLAAAPGPGRAPGGAGAPVVLGGRRYWSRSVALDTLAAGGTRIVGLISTADADQSVAALRVASAALGLVGLALAILLGGLWSLQVTRPVERLARFSERIAQGRWDEPLALDSVRELEVLVRSLDRMRRDLVDYRERLVSSERHAAWSQMAQLVAHEIKNPLTPIAVSVADLKRSFELGRPDFPAILDQAARTIGAEIESLKHILQEFADFGRLPEPRLESCRLADLWSDLAALYAGEVAAGRLAFSEAPADAVLAADAGQLRQALVNLIKNGLEATAAGGRVEVVGRADAAAVTVTVSDDGPALDDAERARLFTPFHTTKPHGSGLGLAMVERIVAAHHGTVAAEPGDGRGTRFHVRLPRPA